MESYAIECSLDRLILGVDNIRCDVRLSPTFYQTTAKLAGLLIERETGIWTRPEKKRVAALARSRKSFENPTPRS